MVVTDIISLFELEGEPVNIIGIDWYRLDYAAVLLA